MIAFCGWLGSERNVAPPAQVLDAMTRAFRGRRLNETSITGAALALWATTHRIHGALCNAADPWIGIIGSPRWRDTALAEEQRSRGDAAALRLAYREYGTDLLSKLAGAFAFAVLDQTSGKAFIAVDRMGVQRLYFASSNGRLVFGSTADLVRAHPGVGTTVPLQAIYQYLHAYVCRSPGTIYAEQRKLGPAQYLL